MRFRAVDYLHPRAFRRVRRPAFHNVHHSHANANFGEAMYLWDLVCHASNTVEGDGPPLTSTRCPVPS